MNANTKAMEWRTIPIGDLRPAAYNPRKKLKPGDKPEASFALVPGDNPVAAFEHCNLHGLWSGK